MNMSPFEEAMAGQTGRNRQAISPSEEAEALQAEEDGICPCCKRPMNATLVVPAPF